MALPARRMATINDRRICLRMERFPPGNGRVDLQRKYNSACFISGNPSSKKGTPLMPNQTETHRIHRSPSARRSASMICMFIVGLLLAHADKLDARAETRRTADSESPDARADLQRRVEALEAEVAELK